MQTHRRALKNLEENISLEREKQLKKVESRLAKKRDDLRLEIAAKEKKISKKRREVDKHVILLNGELEKRHKPKELKWQASCMIWCEKAKRKYEKKVQEDKEHEKASKGKKKGRKT